MARFGRGFPMPVAKQPSATLADIATGGSVLVMTSESTSSTSFTDLTTTTDSVTVTVPASGIVMVSLSAEVFGAGSGSSFQEAYVGFALSGANTASASQTQAFAIQNDYGNSLVGKTWGCSYLLTNLTAGSTTFKMKYQSTSGTSSTFSNRQINVVPINNTKSRVASVATNESTSSLSYTSLTTTTDTVTLTVPTSGLVLVLFNAGINNNLGISSSLVGGAMSYALSGSNTRFADDTRAILHPEYAYGFGQYGNAVVETGLTAGSTTFAAKYRAVGGNTASFSQRSIAAIPLAAMPISPAAAYVATSESTTSTTYTDLATATDSVTVNIGGSGQALVSVFAQISGSVRGVQGFAGFAISGASTASATDTYSLLQNEWDFGLRGINAVFLQTGLTAGSTTFKMKYRATGGTATFAYRRIAVIPL